MLRGQNHKKKKIKIDVFRKFGINLGINVGASSALRAALRSATVAPDSAARTVRWRSSAFSLAISALRSSISSACSSQEAGPSRTASFLDEFIVAGDEVWLATVELPDEIGAAAEEVADGDDDALGRETLELKFGLVLAFELELRVGLGCAFAPESELAFELLFVAAPAYTELVTAVAASAWTELNALP